MISEYEKQLFAACIVEAKRPEDDRICKQWEDRLIRRGRFKDLLLPKISALRGYVIRWRTNPEKAFEKVQNIELEEFLENLPLPADYDEDQKHEMIQQVRNLVISAKRKAATPALPLVTTEVATREAAVTFPVPNAQSQTIYYINNVHGNINQGSLAGNDENGANKSSELQDQIREGFSGIRNEIKNSTGQLLQGQDRVSNVVREATAAKAPRPESENPPPASPRDLDNAFTSTEVATPDAPAPNASSKGVTASDRLFQNSPDTSFAKMMQNGFQIQGHNRKTLQKEIKSGESTVPESHVVTLEYLLEVKMGEGITNLFEILGNKVLVDDPVNPMNQKAFAWVEERDGDPVVEDSDWLKNVGEYAGFDVIHHLQVTFQGEDEENTNRIVVLTADSNDARGLLEKFLSYLSQGAYKNLATCVLESPVHDKQAAVPISKEVLASVLDHLRKPEHLTLQYWDVSIEQESVVGCHSGVKFIGCNFPERRKLKTLFQIKLSLTLAPVFAQGEKPLGFQPSGGTPWIATLFGKATKKGGKTPPETVLVRAAAEGRHNRLSDAFLLVSKEVEEGTKKFAKGVDKVPSSYLQFRKPFYVHSEE